MANKIPSKPVAVAAAEKNGYQYPQLSPSYNMVVAVSESFTPADAGDWDATITKQDAALNELAARVKALEDAIAAL